MFNLFLSFSHSNLPHLETIESKKKKKSRVLLSDVNGEKKQRLMVGRHNPVLQCHFTITPLDPKTLAGEQ